MKVKLEVSPAIALHLHPHHLAIPRKQNCFCLGKDENDSLGRGRIWFALSITPPLPPAVLLLVPGAKGETRDSQPTCARKIVIIVWT